MLSSQGLSIADGLPFTLVNCSSVLSSAEGLLMMFLYSYLFKLLKLLILYVHLKQVKTNHLPVNFVSYLPFILGGGISYLTGQITRQLSPHVSVVSQKLEEESYYKNCDNTLVQ